MRANAGARIQTRTDARNREREKEREKESKWVTNGNKDWVGGDDKHSLNGDFVQHNEWR